VAGLLGVCAASTVLLGTYVLAWFSVPARGTSEVTLSELGRYAFQSGVGSWYLHAFQLMTIAAVLLFVGGVSSLAGAHRRSWLLGGSLAMAWGTTIVAYVLVRTGPIPIRHFVYRFALESRSLGWWASVLALVLAAGGAAAALFAAWQLRAGGTEARPHRERWAPALLGALAALVAVVGIFALPWYRFPESMQSPTLQQVSQVLIVDATSARGWYDHAYLLMSLGALLLAVGAATLLPVARGRVSSICGAAALLAGAALVAYMALHTQDNHWPFRVSSSLGPGWWACMLAAFLGAVAGVLALLSAGDRVPSAQDEPLGQHLVVRA
jgi:hypothetical protein